MADTPAPRIVFEASEVHRARTSSTKFASKEEINDSSKDPTQLYARTKLAIILGVKYGLLDRVIRPNEDRVFALAVHPGAVRIVPFSSSYQEFITGTDMMQVNTAMQQQWKDAYPGLLGKLITTAMTTIGRSPEQGSFSALYAATSPEVEEKGWNGYYFTDPGQPGKETAQASNLGLGAALWDLSHKMIEDKVGEGGMVDWDVKV